MADWMAQAQAGVDRWLETQREFWATLVQSGMRAPSEAPGNLADLQRQAVDAWRESASRIVEAQARFLTDALGGRAGGDAEGLVRRWADAQREMWQGWLDLAGGGLAGQGSQGWQDAGRQLVEALQQGVEQLSRAQADWARAWGAPWEDTQPGRRG